MNENEMMELYPLERAWHWQFNMGDKNQLAIHCADLQADIKTEEEWRKRQAKIDYATYLKATPEERARWDAKLVEIRKERAQARQGREALKRLAAMLDNPEKQHLKAKIVRFLTDMDPEDAQPYRGLLLGRELGGDSETNAKLDQIMKETRRLAEDHREMKPRIAGVPALVERVNKDNRDTMGEFYRLLYSEMTAFQRAIADAMGESGNSVRGTSRSLKASKEWGSAPNSPSSISRELEKMDKLFTDKGEPSPFADRKYTGGHAAEIVHRKRRTNPDDPNSIEIEPIRPRGYQG